MADGHHDENELFYKQLIEYTKTITLDCKTLVKLSNDKGRDDDIVDSSVSAATHSSQLMEIVQDFVSRNSHKEDKRLLLQSLQDSTKSVGTAVVEFIRAARAVSANPFDFLTRQRLNNTSITVAESLKGTISILEVLKHAMHEVQENNNADHIDETMVGSDGVRDTAEAMYIEPRTSIIVANVDHLQEAAKAGDQQKVIDAARIVSGTTSEILTFSRGVAHIEASADRLREATIAVISSARVVLKSPGDPLYIAQLDNAGVKVAEALSVVMYAARSSVGEGDTTNNRESASWTINVTPTSRKEVASPRTSTTPESYSPQPQETPLKDLAQESAQDPPPLDTTTQTKSILPMMLPEAKESAKVEQTSAKVVEASEASSPPQQNSSVSSVSPPSSKSPEKAKETPIEADKKTEKKRPKSSFFSMFKKRDSKASEIKSAQDTPVQQEQQLSRSVSQKIEASGTDEAVLPSMERSHSLEAVNSPSATLVQPVVEPQVVKESMPLQVAPTTNPEQHITVGLSRNPKKPAQTKLAKETANKILQAVSERIPKLNEELRNLPHDTSGRIVEHLASLLQEFGEEYRSLTSSQTTVEFPSVIMGGTMTPKQTEAKSSMDYSEWARMTVKYKMNAKFGTTNARTRKANPFQTDDTKDVGSESEKLAKNLMETANPFAEAVVEMVILAYESVYDVGKDALLLQNAVQNTGMTLKQILVVSGLVGRFESENRIAKALDAATTAVSSIPSRGKLDEALLAAASGPMRPLVEASLELRIFSESNGVRVLAVQLMATVIATVSKPWDNTSYLQIAATSKTIVGSVARLLDAVETKRFLAVTPTALEKEEIPLLQKDEESTDVNIWEEPNDSATIKQDWSTGEEGNKTGRMVVKAATLNKLVEMLTSEKNFDNQFLKTFMLTYQSFTSPFRLLEKLLQRYNAPSTVVEDRRVPIQLRVVAVLKHLMQHHFVDLDTKEINCLKEFVDVQLPRDGHADLARLLGVELHRGLAERAAKINYIQSIPITDMSVPEGQLSPAALFLALNESEIARQLTLIEFKIFEAVEPAELLNQSWNKNELKHRAPNILDMISRGNRLSFWVASMILWSDTVEDRCRMMTKFITIADHVARMNNFSTLMGILAGLNMSSITRLRKTLDILPPNHMQTFVNLEKLMSPNSSFKTYRQTMHKATPPVLPYIGTYLSDLTFIEDGNPDKISNLINWQKRELVRRVIVEIQTSQQTRYDFPVVEPINTFLTELPAMTDKELYDLSLALEAREPKENKMMYATLKRKTKV